MGITKLQGYIGFEAAELCYLQRKNETQGLFVHPGDLAGRRVPWKRLGTCVWVYWLQKGGCELKSI